MRVAWLKDLRLKDLAQVGGKNSSLGEMTGALSAAGIRVPGGFATTAGAFREFIAANKLEERIAEKLKDPTIAATSMRSPRAASQVRGLDRRRHRFHTALEKRY